MAYMLDTHTFLWYAIGDEQLSFTAKKCVVELTTAKFVSIVTFWELGIKLNTGKLALKLSLDELYDFAIKEGFDILPVTFEDTKLISTLPLHHRDPFDRMIIA